MIPVLESFQQLARQRPLFHSEADFQHALAWELQRQAPEAAIRLELPIRLGTTSLHVDIWAAAGDEAIAIELKYKKRKLTYQQGLEIFALRADGAPDIGRYDFIKDIRRLEQLVGAGLATMGYAILLTNDWCYWQPSARATQDHAFHLLEGSELAGLLAWAERAGPGSIKGREAPLLLEGRYALRWERYSEVAEQRAGAFRALCVMVDRQALG